MPKVIEIEQYSDMDPEQLEAALKENTRFSLTPFRGSPFAGDKSLKGKVKDGDVDVGLSQRDWLTLMQPTFQGRIEALSTGGSRLVGRAGMPAHIVWAMRLSTAVAVPAAIVAAAWPVLSELGSQGPLAAGALALFMSVFAILGVGVNVAHAEKQIPQLEATLASLAGVAPPLGDGQSSASEADAALERARRSQASQSSREA